MQQLKYRQSRNTGFVMAITIKFCYFASNYLHGLWLGYAYHSCGLCRHTIHKWIPLRHDNGILLLI